MVQVSCLFLFPKLLLLSLIEAELQAVRSEGDLRIEKINGHVLDARTIPNRWDALMLRSRARRSHHPVPIE